MNLSISIHFANWDPNRLIQAHEYALRPTDIIAIGLDHLLMEIDQYTKLLAKLASLMPEQMATTTTTTSSSSAPDKQIPLTFRIALDRTLRTTIQQPEWKIPGGTDIWQQQQQQQQ